MALVLLSVVFAMFAPLLNPWHWLSGALIVLVYSSRLWLSKRFLTASDDRKNQSLWEWVFFTSAASGGACRGLFTSLMIRIQSPETDLMAMFLVVALTAGAIPSLGSLSRGYVAHVVAVPGPAIAVIAVRGDQFGFGLAILAPAYVVFPLTPRVIIAGG